MSTDMESGKDAKFGFFFENFNGELAVTTNYVSVTQQYRADEARFMARQGLPSASRNAAQKTADALRADLNYGPKSTVSRFTKAREAIQRHTRDIQSWVERQLRSQRSTGAGDGDPAWDMHLAELSLVSELMAVTFLDLAETQAYEISTDAESRMPSRALLDRFTKTFGSALQTETDEVEASEQQVIALAKLLRLAEQRLHRDAGDASTLANFARALNPLLDIGVMYHGIDETEEELVERIDYRRSRVQELTNKLDTAAAILSKAAADMSHKFEAFMRTAREEYTGKKSRKQLQSVQQASIGHLNSDVEAFCLLHEITSQDKAGEQAGSPAKAKSRKSRSAVRRSIASKTGQGSASSEADRRMWRVIRTIWEPTADEENSTPKEWIQVPDSDALSASSAGSRTTNRSGGSSVTSNRHANEYKHIKVGQNFNQPPDESSVDYGTAPLVKPGPNIRVTGPIEPPKDAETKKEMEDYLTKMREWFKSLSGPDEEWDAVWKGSVLSDEPQGAAPEPGIGSLEDTMRDATLHEDEGDEVRT
ncbi:hypothetical protein JCM24511_06076 [Saitozyma sp. JCM 24511]|nr:hypothetical protein JCM24511_06076 [Saitozyma sp. JCM 24511]